MYQILDIKQNIDIDIDIDLDMDVNIDCMYRLNR